MMPFYLQAFQWVVKKYIYKDILLPNQRSVMKIRK